MIVQLQYEESWVNISYVDMFQLRILIWMDHIGYIRAILIWISIQEMDIKRMEDA